MSGDSENDTRYQNEWVWANAPDDAIIAKVSFYKSDKYYAGNIMTSAIYTRAPKRTKDREIAERVAKENCTFSPEYTVSLWADIIESAILEAKKGDTHR